MRAALDWCAHRAGAADDPAVRALLETVLAQYESLDSGKYANVLELSASYDGERVSWLRLRTVFPGIARILTARRPRSSRSPRARERGRRRSLRAS